MIRKAIGLLIVPLLFLPSSSDSLTSSWLAQEKQYQSAIQIWTIEKNKPKFLCSGVAIAPDTVVTASSCIYASDKTPKAETLFISTASTLDYNISLTQALQSVSSVAKKGIPHPDADLMVIFLNQWLNVEPALLLTPIEAFQIRLLPPVFLVGFGLSKGPPQSDQESKDSWFLSRWWYGTKPDVPGQKYTAKSQIVQVEAHQLLLGNAQDDGAACLGDEGGPIYAHIESAFANSQRVLGILTSSPNQKTCAKPSPALRLDAFRDFINETMVQECRAKERIWCQVEGLLNPGYNDEPQVDTPESKKTEAIVEVPTQPLPPSPTASPPQAPELPPAPEPQKATTPPVQKPIKRRLAVAAEGAGCSCQQVFTKTEQ